jgi:hypothetical protein
MFTTILTACALSGVQISPAPSMERFWWVFIERTKVEAKLSEEESKQMMQAHLGNFDRLHKLNKLQLAGPLRDPLKTRRGIVLLTVKTRKEVDESFKPDPFFQRGIFAGQVIPMRADFGEILRNTGPDANDIEENRLVVFERAADSKDVRGHAGRDPIRDGAAAGLAFHAKSTSDNSVQEIAIFKGKNDSGIEAWLATDPLLKSGALKATVYTQWLGKGCLPEDPKPVSYRKSTGRDDWELR